MKKKGLKKRGSDITDKKTIKKNNNLCSLIIFCLKNIKTNKRAVGKPIAANKNVNELALPALVPAPFKETPRVSFMSSKLSLSI